MRTSANSLKLIKIVAGPVVGLVMYGVFVWLQDNLMAARMAGIAAWMAAWWIMEAVPLAITSLLPVFLYPTLGVMSTKDVAPSYMNEVIFLFIGGFIIAFAMERWNLHKRIALKIILLIGNDARRILLGVMLAGWFLSMLISNTATTMMLLPTIIAVGAHMKVLLQDGEHHRKFTIGLLLGLAYAASIGGTATLTGTPTNLIFLKQYETAIGSPAPVSYGQWFLFGFPLSLAILFAAYWVLRTRYCPKSVAATGKITLFEEEYRKLGKMTVEEWIVAADFAILAFLWFFRKDLELGFITIKGWSNLVPYPDLFHDSTVAVLMATVLFLIPSVNRPNEMIITWEQVKALPYDIILLFGGGFAMAQGFVDSGLTDWLACQLEGIQHLHPLFIVLLLCLFMTFLTEVTSNMATTQLILPVLAAISIATDLNPLLLMIPATISASMAFMLPVATAPNAIVFGSHQLKIPDMAKSGLLINLMGAILITAFMLLLGSWVFGL